MNETEVKARYKVSCSILTTERDILDLNYQIDIKTTILQKLSRDDAVDNEVKKMIALQKKREERALKREQESMKEYNNEEMRNEY